MISERDAFGPALKAERDRRGITLQAIADRTKIGVSLLSALERNDMSRWPKGIFRRAFVREYVTALGLPAEPLVAEFVRLFPEGPCPEPAESTEFRLMLDDGTSASWMMWRRRVLTATVELVGVMAIGVLVAWGLDLRILTACGGVALLYYPVASLLVERGSRPRLMTQSLGSIEWLLSPGAGIGHLRTLWSREQSATESSGGAESADAPKAAPQEWRTASH